MKILASFRNVFIALNVFIVPVVIATMLSYGMKEAVISNSHGFEVGFQSLVMLLMFLSSNVGLPLYIIAVWNSYKNTSMNTNDESENQSLGNESQGSSLMFDDNLLTPLTSESTLDRLNEFTRRLNDRMAQRMLADLQRRRNADDFSELRILPELEISSEIEMESATPETIASAEPSEEKQDQCYLDSVEEKPKVTDLAMIYQFQVPITEESPDLAVRFEVANKESKETTETEVTEEQNRRQPARSQDVSPFASGKYEERNDGIILCPLCIHMSNRVSSFSESQL
ncbi:unnamed protein product [Larinioides sclopetarius]